MNDNLIYSNKKLKKQSCKTKKHSKCKKKIPKMREKKILCTELLNWLYTKISIKDTTEYNYLSIINSRIKPYFKNMPLDDVSEIHIINFTRYLQEEGLGNKRIKDILLILRQFFKYIRKDIKIEYPKVRKKTIKTFQEREIKILEMKLLKSKDIKDFGIILVLYSGLRIGELCALRWDDIDIEKRIMYITKTLVRVKSNDNIKNTKIIIDTPKTDTSIREVPIHNALISYLKKFKSESKDENYVLTNSDKFMAPNKYYHYYMAKLNKLNIPKYTFHTLRHTFATRALINGIDIKTLSDILGHSSVKITLERYVHIKTEEKISQINKLPLMTK